MKVSIIELDPEQPWIREYRKIPEHKLKSIQTPDHMNLRSYWALFCENLDQAFKKRGHLSSRIIMPRWDIDEEHINRLDTDIAIIPHTHLDLLPNLKKIPFFYMQVIQRWLFTLDSNGWSAACSNYPCNDFIKGNSESSTYEQYRNKLLQNNESKFLQPVRQDRQTLIQKRELPDGNFIFFPCQVPHDESIKYFSDYSELEVIKALNTWANQHQTHIVFKGHPANPRAMDTLKKATTSPYCLWSDASIHDLLDYCHSVATLNSGVGFETLFHSKPLITFGKTEYDCVSIKATPSSFSAAWKEALGQNQEARNSKYRQFVDWFCTKHAIDLSNMDQLGNRLDEVVNNIEKIVESKL